tara:strand:+ start:1756 stop:1920 length:165 start_codon:yes stop_codon:yes gene_type:complete
MQDDTITIDERDLIKALIGAQRLAAHRRTARKQKHVAKRKGKIDHRTGRPGKSK